MAGVVLAAVIVAGSWQVADTVPWYGPGLYGNQTACGQTLTRHLRGVAHRTLPCGTRVELRWHGHRVVTKVVDRGPYGTSSPLDLTARTNCWDLNGGRYQSPCSSRHNVRWRVLDGPPR